MNNEAIGNTQHISVERQSSEVARALQLFKAGSNQFGVFADDIATIVAWREPAPLPQAPKSVLGVVSIQGRMLTLLDLARLQGGEGVSSDTAPQRIVALRGDEQLALAVESAGESIQLTPADFDAKEAAGKLVLGVLHRDGAEINILNLKELFPTAIQGRERRRRRF